MGNGLIPSNSNVNTIFCGLAIRRWNGLHYSTVSRAISWRYNWILTIGILWIK